MSNTVKQVGGAIVGGIIGFFGGGGPSGAVKGAMYGYSLGAMASTTELDAVEGPRVEDLEIQSGSYGVPINEHHGVNEFAGNIIWLKGNKIDENQHREVVKTGGKGGGSKQTVISYTYSATFAVALARGPMGGVAKIYADNVLIYDGSSSDPVTLAESEQSAIDFEFYSAGSNNEQDDLIVAEKGSGCPAFRNVSYIVFDDFQLTDYGNRIPNFRFVMYDVDSASSSDTRELRTLHTGSGNFTYGVLNPVAGAGHQRDLVRYSGGSFTLYHWEMDADSFTTYSNSVGSQTTYNNLPKVITQEYNGNDFTDLVFESASNYPFNPASIDPRGEDMSSGAGTANLEVYSVTNSTMYVLFYIDNEALTRMAVINGPSLGTAISVITFPSDEAQTIRVSGEVHAVHYRGDILMVTNTGGLMRIRVQSTPKRAYVVLRDSGIKDPEAGGIRVDNAPAPVGETYNSIGVDPISGRVFVGNNTGAEIFEIDVETMTTIATYTLPETCLSGEFIVSHGGDILHYPAFTTGQMCTIDISSGSAVKVGDFALSFTEQQLQVIPMSQYVFAVRQRQSPTGPTTSNAQIVTCGNNFTAGTNKTVANTVLEILSENPYIRYEDIDVSGIANETIDGFTIPNRITMVSKLRLLMKTYQLEVVMEDYKIKVFSRANASNVATLSTDDIQAHEVGQEVPDQDSINVKPDQLIPGEVWVNHRDPARDYEESTQFYSRGNTLNNSPYQIDTGMALSVNKAKQIAVIIMADAQQEAKGIHTIRTSFKYSYIERGDLITVQTDDGTYTDLRVIDKEMGKPGIVIIKAVYSDTSNYSSSAVGETGQAQVATLTPLSETDLHLMDTVPLRDSDIDVGFYYAVSQRTPASRWAGAQVVASRDYTRFTVTDNILNAVTFGSTTNALTDTGITGIWDFTETLNISMSNGTLASATESQVMIGLTNVMLYGAPGRWEIIKFVTATLEGDGTYTISQLLRGYWGTSPLMGLHNAGDKCILVENDTFRRYVLQSTDDYLNQFFLKATTLGRVFTKEKLEIMEAAGTARTPRAPSHIEATRDNDTITFRWFRQALHDRKWHGGEWETTEAYNFEIDILNGAGGAVLRTITASGSNGQFTVQYTSAQQTTDFGSPQGNIYADFFEVDSIVGRGDIAQVLGI